jgi:hypothetical protein
MAKNNNSLIVFFLFMLFLLAVSCNKNNTKKPSPLIGEEQMIELLVGVHLTDAIAEKRASGDVEKSKAIAKKMQQELFENNKINAKIFYENQNYYELNPKQYMQMYDEVIKQLEKIK